MNRHESITFSEAPEEAKMAQFLEAMRGIGDDLANLKTEYKSTLTEMQAFSSKKHGEYRGLSALGGAVRDEAKLENIRRTGKRIPEEPLNTDLSDTRPAEGTAGAMDSVGYYLDVIREIEEELGKDLQKIDPAIMDKMQTEYKSKIKKLEDYLKVAKNIDWKAK